MKKAGYILSIFFVSISLAGEPAHAAVNTALFYTPAGILDIAILIGALVCLIWASKVLSLVKGGLLSKSWQMFAFGFGLLLVARILALAETVSLFQIPAFTLTGIYLAMILIWLYGLYRTKKILS